MQLIMQQNITLESTNLSIQLVLCAYARYQVHIRIEGGDRYFSSTLALPDVLAAEAIALLNSHGYEVFSSQGKTLETWVPVDYADRLANRTSWK